jgi:aerobic-type carbon monoxide dehydrogenase small subunit (CoxS/CutS family)
MNQAFLGDGDFGQFTAAVLFAVQLRGKRITTIAELVNYQKSPLFPL